MGLSTFLIGMLLFIRRKTQNKTHPSILKIHETNCKTKRTLDCIYYAAQSPFHPSYPKEH